MYVHLRNIKRDIFPEVNVPLQSMEKIELAVKTKETPVYVYCYSGSRSSQAVNAMKHMGYMNVTNIGGISSYMGKVER